MFIAELMNLPCGPRQSNSPMSSRLWASVNERWTVSNTCRTSRKIWPMLDEERTMSLVKIQRGVVIGVITGHCIMGKHAKRIGLAHLANDFCRNCWDEEEETVTHLLGIYQALCQRRIKYMLTYYMDDIEELSTIDIGSLNCFIRGSEWLWDFLFSY